METSVQLQATCEKEGIVRGAHKRKTELKNEKLTLMNNVNMVM